MPRLRHFLRPQSSSLRDHQHPGGQERARLFDAEPFKRKFVTRLADLRGELGFRIVGYVRAQRNAGDEEKSENEEQFSNLQCNAGDIADGAAAALNAAHTPE
jgi:hypothetical protein